MSKAEFDDLFDTLEKHAGRPASECNDLLYRMARHLLNPDDIPLHKWAVNGAYLLSELERLDPERYKEAMKPRAV